jgi:predicted O-methyltransferase YrrM
MDAERWQAVDGWFADRLRTSDDALESALSANEAAGLPPISVSRNLGKFLEIIAAAISARRILEIGTLGGYSTICLARALPPGGMLVTLEISQEHATVARANIARAGLADRVEVLVGDARESLAGLAGQFDLVFIDANKEGYPDYLREALGLTRPGGLIVADNVVRQGRILDPDDAGSDVVGIREFVNLVAAEARISASVLQTVGDKSYDGFLIARVLD